MKALEKDPEAHSPILMFGALRRRRKRGSAASMKPQENDR
jgi:hypothetical protein